MQKNSLFLLPLLIPVVLASFNVIPTLLASVVVICLSYLAKHLIEAINKSNEVLIKELQGTVATLQDYHEKVTVPNEELVASLKENNKALSNSILNLNERLVESENIIKSISFGKEENFTKIKRPETFRF